MEKKRSGGITALGSIIILYGLFLFFASLGDYWLDNFSTSSISINKLLNILPPAIWAYKLAFLSGAISILAGIGLMRIKPWGRMFTLYALVPLLVIVITYYDLPMAIRFSQQRPYSQLPFLPHIMRISFGILLLFYFTRPKVKEQFK